MARCRRVGAGKPDVERDDPRLGPEAQDRQEEHHVAGRRRERGRRHAEIGKGGRGRARREEQEGREHERQPAVSHGQVPGAGLDRVRFVGVRHDEEVRGERHPFPHQEERQHVAGAGNQAHGEEEEIEHGAEEPQRVAAVVRLGVAGAVETARHGDESDERQEERAQGIQPERETVGDGQERGDLDDERHLQGEERERDAESRSSAHDGAERGHAARDAVGRREHRGDRTERVAGQHEEEQEGHRRPTAARMPRRMSAGSGGQPSTKTSTGMI